jgi:prepilin-type N-terminal cleavage/methylation domain-containing protein
MVEHTHEGNDKGSGMQSSRGGFTLIELSIVLVIIGLVVGSVLVGQDLIRAAYVRATISQIEKYDTAANTFYGKYGYLPGDITATAAQSFGFDTNLAGNGNGLIEGGVCAGEGLGFWSDLTYANGMNLNMIAGSWGAPLGGGDAGTYYGYISPITVQAFPNCWPESKFGGGNYISITNNNGLNSFNIIQMTGVGGTSYGQTDGTSMVGANGLTVSQAYMIDKKMDDGLPQAGRVTAQHNTLFDMFWSLGNTNGGNSGLQGVKDPATNGPVVSGDGVATPASSLTCYDNGNSPGATEHYSIGFNGGTGVNCSLSLLLQ